MELKDFFDSQSTAAYVTEAQSNMIPFLGEAYFPAIKQAGLDLKSIKINKGLPLVLAPSTFDSKAKFRERIKVQAVQTEMPFFREGFQIKERDRQEILRVQSSNDHYAQTVLNAIYDDTNDLVTGARIVPERMIWQLMAPESGSPGIAITADGVDYTYNYDPDGSFKKNNFVTLTNKWSTPASSTPISDMRDAIEAASDINGNVITTAVMSQKTFTELMNSAEVKSAILAQNSTANIIVTPAVVKALFVAVLGINIIVYKKKYRDEEGNTKAFYPDGVVTLLPDGQLGNTVYGTTPEEADALYAGRHDVAIVNTGVALSRVISDHPVEYQIYASEIVLPSFTRMDDIYVMKVD